MTNQTSVADTAATQILAHEILYDIGVPASREMVSRISARLEEVVDQAVRGERERCAAVCKKRKSVINQSRFGDVRFSTRNRTHSEILVSGKAHAVITELK